MAEAILKATREGYSEALAELGAANNRIVALDADLSKSTGSAKFKKSFPERFFDAGVAEANMIGIAAGLAYSGKISFASTFAVFATGRVYDQVRVSVAYAKANVKIVGSHAGLSVGEDGATHQALEDIALMRVLPNMKVIVPADFTEAKAATKAAAEIEGPVYLRMARPKTRLLFDEKNYSFELGKSRTMCEGNDLAIVSTGIVLEESLKAAEELQKKGISAEVVNIASIKPLDEKKIIALAKSFGAIVSVEDHSVIGGLGGAVAETVAENYPCKVARIGVRDKFGESGTQEELYEKYGLNAKAIVLAAEKIVKGK
ncbi:MAG: transketolase family protein [Candidatus Diapherotrites archaeon]